MKKSLSVLITFALGVIFFLGGPLCSFAQEDQFTLEEITVTAQKREEKVQNVPVAITVANQEQMERQQINDITDLDRITPALEFKNPDNGPSGGGQIRGIGTTDYTASSTGSVAVVIDDVPAGEIPNPNVFDVERVEVLRGPQGTLFGQAASAGVVNMVTVAPDLTRVSGYAHVEYAHKDSMGSGFGQELFKGALNVPLTGNSAMRISAMSNTYRGIHTNLYDHKDSVSNNYGARLRYLYAPSDSLSLDLIADYNKKDEKGPRLFTLIDVVPGSFSAQAAANAGVTVEEGNQDVYAPFTPRKQSENYGASARFDYTLSDYTLTSITAYRKQTEGPDHESIFMYPAPFPIIVDRPDNNTDADQFSQELRITSPSGEALEYVAGLYYSTYKKDVFGYGTDVSIWLPSVNPSPFAPPIYIPVAVASGSDYNAGNDSLAAYGHLSYNITDAATLFGGLRVTRQTVKIKQTEHHTGATGSLSDTDDNLSWRIGGQYRFNPQVMAFASVTQGYKPGHHSEGSLDETGTIIDLPAIIKPEKPLSYEVGIKASVLDNRMAIDFNVFHNTVKDYQGSVCTANTEGAWTCVAQNLSEVVSKGIELDVIGRPMAGLSLTSGLIYVSAEYPDGYHDQAGDDIGGEQLVNVPEWKFVLSGDYTHGLTDALLGYLAVNGTYRTEVQTALPYRNPKTEFKGWWDLGGQIGLRSVNNTWSVSLWGRNLLDEHRPVAMVTETDGQTAAIYGSNSFRQVGLSLDYKF